MKYGKGCEKLCIFIFFFIIKTPVWWHKLLGDTEQLFVIVPIIKVS